MSGWTVKDRQILREAGWSEEEIRRSERVVNDHLKEQRRGWELVIACLCPLSWPRVKVTLAQVWSRLTGKPNPYLQVRQDPHK